MKTRCSLKCENSGGGIAHWDQLAETDKWKGVLVTMVPKTSRKPSRSDALYASSATPESETPFGKAERFRIYYLWLKTSFATHESVCLHCSANNVWPPLCTEAPREHWADGGEGDGVGAYLLKICPSLKDGHIFLQTCPWGASQLAPGWQTPSQLSPPGLLKQVPKRRAYSILTITRMRF